MMSDRIDHAAVSEYYNSTPETLAELRLLLDEAPQLPYRASPRTHGIPSDGPTYVALEAQLEGRWEEVATGCYDRWSGMGLALAAAAINALPALLDTTDELAHMTEARDNARAEVERLTAKVNAVQTLADEWTYKGEFGWGDGSHAYGPDCEGPALDHAAAELRRILDEGAES